MLKAPRGGATIRFIAQHSNVSLPKRHSSSPHPNPAPSLRLSTQDGAPPRRNATFDCATGHSACGASIVDGIASGCYTTPQTLPPLWRSGLVLSFGGSEGALQLETGNASIPVFAPARCC